MYVINAGFRHVIDQSLSVAEFHLPVYVQRYCHDIKTRYLQQSVLPESEWPPSLGGQYIRLALISQGRLPYHHRYEDVIEQQRDYTRGDYDKILEYKTKIELTAAFDKVICEGGNELPLKMLIDGAPGVGKTTLSRKVSCMWAEGELLERFWLVLLLHLRERAISKAKTVDEVFYHEDSELQRDIVKFVKERSGDGVLIIFDGFDELSSYERSKQSLFLDISRGKILPECAVVITSRPYASRSLQELPLIKRHIEVLGFTDEQVKACIRQKIKDEVKAEELCTELKDRLDIASICQIPLNCSIVLYVYEQENYSLPRTLTELYELFVLHSLKRFMKRTQNVEAADRLLDLMNLQSPSNDNLTSLCKLAYKGLEDDKLVFSRNDVEKNFVSEHQESSTDLPVLDLMTSAKSYSSRGAQDTYSFLHLTIQEFLAAYWVAHYSSDTTKLELFQQKLMDNRFRMVLLFLSGMTKLNFPRVFDTFGQISWDRDLVHVCHLLYESGNHFLCKSISNEYFSSMVVKLTGSRFDALVISHFVAYSGCQWDELELRPDDAKVVHKVFSTCTVENTSIQNIVLNFHEWSGGDTELKLLDELNQINRINIPIKEMRYNQNLASKMLSTALMGRNAIREKECTITWDYTDNPENCYLVEQFCKTLAECLAQSSSVTEVRLKSVLAEDIDRLFTHLSRGNTPVSKLTCLTCTIGQYKSSSKSKQPPVFQKFCTSLARYLSRNTSLIQVDLDIPLHSDIFSSCMETIKSGLVHNESLQKLNVKLFDGEVFFLRNIRTNEIELIEQYFQSSDCDPSPPQAKRPCRDNQECADFSPPGRRDSPYQLHTHGLDMAHPNQLQPHQFQPQTQKSNRLSVLSPPPPPPNNPVKDRGSPHDIMDLSVESSPPQDIQSPGLTDLTQDSPQPHDHVDNAHFHSHLSALPSTTTTPQLSSVMVKQENQFCQAKQLISVPPSSGNYSHMHSHTMNPSVLAPVATPVFPPLPSAKEEHQRNGSNPLAQSRVLHQDRVLHTQASHNVRQVQPVTHEQLGQSLNPPPVQHNYGSSSSLSVGYTQSLPEQQHLSQSPSGHPRAPRHPISHTTQTVTHPHLSDGVTLMSHSPKLEEQQRQMGEGHLRLPRSHQDQLIHSFYQNLDNSQSTCRNKLSQSYGWRRGHRSHCGPYSHSRGSTPLHHQCQNFPPPLSVRGEHQSNISDPVAQPIFSHQDQDFYAQSSHERPLPQERPSMSPSPVQNYYSGTAGSPPMRHTLYRPQPFPLPPPNHPGYLPRHSESQATRTMRQQTRSHQWNVETPLFPNSGQQQHGPWQMSSSSSDYSHLTSYRNRPLPSTYSLSLYQNSPSAHTSQSTQNDQPSHSTDTPRSSSEN